MKREERAPQTTHCQMIQSGNRIWATLRLATLQNWRSSPFNEKLLLRKCSLRPFLPEGKSPDRIKRAEKMRQLKLWHLLVISDNLQGLSERMSKVQCLLKSQFSLIISFLNCFGSEISCKFIPYSIQVHQNHPKPSLEADASDVLSGCYRLFEADQ